MDGNADEEGVCCSGDEVKDGENEEEKYGSGQGTDGETEEEEGEEEEGLEVQARLLDRNWFRLVCYGLPNMVVGQVGKN